MILARELPTLDHLLTMTDDVGIIQHAREGIPNRSTGYCTDDVARALIIALARLRQVNDADALRIAATYLAYLHEAQRPDGRFRNFMSYDRRWLDDLGTHDSVGRAIWSLGFGLRYAPRPAWRRLCAEMLDRALAAIPWLEYPRAQAYAALGLVHAAEYDATPARLEALRFLAGALAQHYTTGRAADWDWFEETMTYDNARLPEAMLRAGTALRDQHIAGIGASTLAFLGSVVYEDGLFVPIGNEGWYRRGGRRARFAQQPLEAWAMVDAELAAFDATGDPAHRTRARIAGAWFSGKNSLGVVMGRDGGCYDGLDENGPNRNMGAESTLAFLGASYAVE